LGILTKAYFLSAIPAVLMIFAYTGREKRQWRPFLAHFLLILVIAGAISGWWLTRNYQLYGNLAGMQEITLTRSVSSMQRAKDAWLVPWREDITSTLKQHIWIGNNSYISLSRTVYFTGYAIIALAVLGMLKLCARGVIRENKVGLLVLLTTYGFFCLGVLYHMAANFALTGKTGGTGGWYMYAAVVPETILLTIGIDHILAVKWMPLAQVVLIAYAATLDFLAVFCKSLPFYAGFFISNFHLQHLPQLYQPAAFTAMVAHLALNKADFVTPAFLTILIFTHFVVLISCLGVYTTRFAATVRNRVGLQ
jgi:hypothetical protein